MEEGLTQALWSIGSRGDVTEMLDHASSAGHPSADVVVLVRAPIALVRRRLDERSSRHSRLQRVADDAIDEELARGEALLDRLVEWWRNARGSTGVLHVKDGSAGAVEELVRVVLARTTA